jgi:hypothetical protein
MKAPQHEEPKAATGGLKEGKKPKKKRTKKISDEVSASSLIDQYNKIKVDCMITADYKSYLKSELLFRFGLTPEMYDAYLKAK